MKRTLILLTALAVAGSPLAAQAATKKPTKRTVVWSYAGVFGAYAKAAGGGGVCTANPMACYTLPTQSFESKVSFRAVDSSGQKVPVQYVIGDDYNSNVLTCTSGDVPVAKGETVHFYLVASPDCTGVPTVGKMTMTVTGKK